MDADELLTTTRAARKRLDFDRPVERALLEECLEIALQAPTGSNRQGWQWIFVSNPDRKAALADLYRRSFTPYSQLPRPEYAAGDPRSEQHDRVLDSARYLADHMQEAPWLLVPCIEGRLGQGESVVRLASITASIFPAVWSFMLAAHSRGLGTSLTTLHLLYEREAADVLGIPFDSHTQVALVPVAHLKGGGFRPARRIPLDAVTHWETW